MDKVPNIISSKDLDYLSDMFNWNYGNYKCTINNVKHVDDEKIRNVLNEGSELFMNNMKQVINILKEASYD